MTKSENVQAQLLELCPDWAMWDAGEWELWTDEDGTRSVHAVFSLFSHYVADRLERGDMKGFERVFAFVETQLGGDDELDNAATTCFLENLVNRVPRCFEMSAFTPFLGPESLSFCEAWDSWRRTTP